MQIDNFDLTDYLKKPVSSVPDTHLADVRYMRRLGRCPEQIDAVALGHCVGALDKSFVNVMDALVGAHDAIVPRNIMPFAMFARNRRDFESTRMTNAAPRVHLRHSRVSDDKTTSVVSAFETRGLRCAVTVG